MLIRAVVLALAAYIVLGYGVRSAMLLIIALGTIAGMVTLWRRVRPPLVLVIAGGLVALSLAIGAWAHFAPGFASLDDFGSGRLSNYAERGHALALRDGAALLFGSGPGTDWMVTSVWGVEAKDAHSDFLHYFWEGGLWAVAALGVYLLGILRLAPAVLAAPLGALAATSLLSNALLARPNVAFLLFALAALLVARSQPQPTRAPNVSLPNLAGQ
jgi:hypothetical protein